MITKTFFDSQIKNPYLESLLIEGLLFFLSFFFRIFVIIQNFFIFIIKKHNLTLKTKNHGNTKN